SRLALPPGTGSATATPSAIAIDDVLNVAVVAEAGTNSVEYLALGHSGPTLIPGRVPVGNVPTGVSVDNVLHLAAVVSYADRSLKLLATPAPGATPSTTPVAPIDLTTLIPPPAAPPPPPLPPFPYSVGFAPPTPLAFVPFASPKGGFIADINPANSANTSE